MTAAKLKLLQELLIHTDTITISGGDTEANFNAELDEEALEFVRDLVLAATI